MQIGYIGLGKMGKGMVLHLLEKGHNVVAWNRSPQPRQEVVAAGASVTNTVAELVTAIKTPRVIWLMLPAKDVINSMIKELIPLLQKGDLIIDGGNSHYKDTVKNAQLITAAGIRFMDVGVSGGPAGARNGACLMIGGEEKDYQELQTLFSDIAAPNAQAFFSGHGAGHFVKMVHNGIEYGMMQAMGEGFSVLKLSPYKFDLQQVAQIYNNKSVIESRLVGWLESGYQKHGIELTDVSGSVAQSGEGLWTAEAAKELNVETPIIKESVEFRTDSQAKPSYTGKVLNVLRNEFGGHKVD